MRVCPDCQKPLILNEIIQTEKEMRTTEVWLCFDCKNAVFVSVE